MTALKGILLDLDHTLYNYDPCHKAGMNCVYDWLSERLSIDRERAEKAFTSARKQVNNSLAESASSHNRILYFQRMLEILQLPALEHALTLYNCYWDTFLEKISFDEGVEETLIFFRNRNLPVCLLTDLTAHIQHRKIRKLHLHQYLHSMVSSEEAGREKPDPIMFNLGMQKLNCKAEELCMIGDNFEKDIVGAAALGIKSFWLNREGKHVSLPAGAEEIAELRSLMVHPIFQQE